MSLTIFSYNDPALYLRDAWNTKRVFNKNFTVRAWAKQLGFSSYGSFYQIIQGKRPLPKKYVRPISDSLKLAPKESLYLETLIDYTRAKTMESKSHYQERLQDLAPGEKLSFYEVEAFHCLKNPLNGAIVELTNLKDFVCEAFWIKERLTIKASVKEIQKAMDMLFDLGLLKHDENGKVKQAHKLLHTKQDVKNEALQEYHKNVLSLAADQISKQEVEDREYNATAMGIKKSDLPKIKEEMRAFLNDMISKYESAPDEACEIYQLGTQFFALTNNKEKLQ
ncbi:MAG: TIGR02147 family protein [Bacteriovoracaceae bacterium]|nr:TIGR02147 family protein [Bacteriovoracaceae bacterium]